MKIGRNKPCPCGSGVKFKRCHGQLTGRSTPDVAAIQQSMQVHDARERVRTAQQGHSKPIISANWNGQQFVAVGNALHYSPKWKTFPDFLSDYVKIKVGADWGNAEIAKPIEDRHVLMQWYDALCRLQKKVITKPGEPSQFPVTGVVACYYSVAYGLYLLEHNVELQGRLLARLKNPGNFQGAYYELLVASAFVLAGFTLTLEDEADPAQKHCEFSAVSPATGKKYWIEAKMRGVAGELGRTEADGTTSNNPLSSFTRQLNAALLKPAADARMIFLDLNADMAADANEDNRPAFVEAAGRRLELYEQKILKPGEAAYVFVTNANFHKNLEAPAQLVAFPYGLGISDFNRPGFYRLSERYKQDRLHADALRVAEGFAKLLTLPATFDGSMPSVGLHGARSPVVIGETYNFEGAGANGEDVIGTVADAVVMEAEKAITVAVNGTDGRSLLLKEPMTDEQLADYRGHPDAYFGKIVRPSKGVKTPYELFEFFMYAYRDLPRDKLLEHLSGRVEGAETMERDDLLAIYCEGMVSASSVFKVKDGVISSEAS
ncbi:MAG TPA: SEC-C domain-containing protein [Allosphingosinicella sp.]|jgi:hypothetical protein|nr:SEC-C domain-containing protein [Allosphingosinicella sp.]